MAYLCPCRLLRIWGLTHSFARSQRLNVFVAVAVGESLHGDVSLRCKYILGWKFLVLYSSQCLVKNTSHVSNLLLHDNNNSSNSGRKIWWDCASCSLVHDSFHIMGYGESQPYCLLLLLNLLISSSCIQQLIVYLFYVLR